MPARKSMRKRKISAKGKSGAVASKAAKLTVDQRRAITGKRRIAEYAAACKINPNAVMTCPPRPVRMSLPVPPRTATGPATPRPNTFGLRNVAAV